MRAALFLILSLLPASPAAATLLAYEPFDYDAGVLDGVAATGTNLTGAYVGSPVPPGFDLVVASPGLDYGNLVGAPGAAGNRLSQPLGTTAASATASVDVDIPVAPGSEIYFGGLFRFDDSDNGTHFARITLSDDANGDEISFGELVVGIRAIGISATVATGGIATDAVDGAFTNGQTLFLFGRYQNSAAADGDVLELVGYDTADADVLPALFDPSDPNAELSFRLDGLDVDLAAVTAVSFTIRGTANNFVDELRIGTRYGDVVPEPGTALLVAAGFAGLGLRARRRRRGR